MIRWWQKISFLFLVVTRIYFRNRNRHTSLQGLIIACIYSSCFYFKLRENCS